MNIKNKILIGTVLFERNRWTPARLPSFKVNELAPALCEAGFAGLELWENHASLIDAQEQVALDRTPLPVSVLNSYCTFDSDGAAGRQLAAELAGRFGSAGVKFNFGGDLALSAQYQDHLSAWIEALPTGCRALCECHGGTVVEEPSRAAEILRPFRDRIGIIVHAFAGKDDSTLQRWIDQFGPMIAHVHASSEFVHNVGFLALRSIEARIHRRVAMLADAGFDGPWTVEFTSGVNRPPESTDALLGAATDDLRVLQAALAC